MASNEVGSEVNDATFVIIGGGIAGVTCAELLPHLCPDESIILITASTLVKAASAVTKLATVIEVFEVEEKLAQTLTFDCPNLRVITAEVIRLDSKEHIVYIADGTAIRYKKLCIATGGKPKIIAKQNPYVLGIRDTDSVKLFQEKLSNAKRVVVVGNGGIATELIYEIQGCQVIWAIKDSSISSTFFDPGAGEFFVPHLCGDRLQSDGPLKRMKYTVTASSSTQKSIPGVALGPDWSEQLMMSGNVKDAPPSVNVEFQCEVQEILNPLEFCDRGLKETEIGEPAESPWPVYVLLTNGHVYGCNFIISATGVIPNTDPFLPGDLLDIADDGGIKVDEKMRTNVPDIFAAGDVCSTSWAQAKHWFQMRLWTQARQMGAYAAKSMSADLQPVNNVTMDFCFELFTHVTKFFGYKVVLVGLFNGQKLGKDYDIIVRVTKGLEYIKVVMQQGRMQGAILVGETNLEETFENLILNQMDLSRYGEDLLNPEIDIEDYFD